MAGTDQTGGSDNTARIEGDHTSINQVGRVDGSMSVIVEQASGPKVVGVWFGLPSLSSVVVDRAEFEVSLEVPDPVGTGMERRVFAGMPGVGKSVLARQLVDRLVGSPGGSGRHVVWIDCSSDASLVGGIRALATGQPGVPGKVESATDDELCSWWKNWVHSQPVPVVAVFDGWDDPEVAVGVMLPDTGGPAGTLTVVTTTSNQVANRVRDASVVEVGQLSRCESVAALTNAKAGGLPDHPETIGSLAALLHDVALAVGLASGWAQQHLDYSYERLKDQLTDDPGRFLANRPEGYHRTIVELWAQIQPSLTASARDLIGELAYMQTASINLSVLGLASPDTLGELRSTGCCTVTYAPNSDAVVSLHQLLAAAIRTEHSPLLADQSLTRICERAAGLFGDDGSEYVRWPLARNVDTWIDTIPEPEPDGPWSEPWIHAHDRLTEYHLDGVQNLKRARVLIDRIAPLTEALAIDHPQSLSTRHNTANLTGKTGNHQQAIQLYEQLLDDQIRVLEADHPSTLTTRNNIAYETGEVGDHQQAIQLYEQLLDDQIRVLEADHPSTLTTRNNIAYQTGEVGDHQQAIQLFESVLDDQIRVLGANHPSALTTRHNIARETGLVGDHQRAIQLYEQLLADQIRVLGADHPSTLTTDQDMGDLKA